MDDTTPSTTRWLVVGALGVLVGLSAAGVQIAGWRPMHLVAFAWVVVALGTLPWSRTLAALVGGVAVVRLLTWTPRVQLHFGKPFALLDAAWTHDSPDVRYGEAFAALANLVGLVLPGADAVHQVNTALGLATVVWVWGALRRDSDEATAAGAALCVGLHPLLAAASTTESPLVLAIALQSAALWGLAREDARGDALTSLSVGLLAHTRPLQLLVAVLLLGVQVRRRGGSAAAPTAVIVGWRALQLGVFVATGGNASGGQWHVLAAMGPSWLGVGPDAAVLMFDPTRSPLAFGLLAVAGGALAWRRPALRAVPMLGLVQLLVYLPQQMQADRVRFQLTTLPWASVLAAVALVAVASRSRVAAVAAAVGVMASAWTARAPYDPPFVWQAEYALLRRALPRLPPDAVVREAGTHDLSGHMGRWAERRSSSYWLTLDEAGPAGTHRWVGAADRHPDAAPVPWDRLEPVVEATVAPVWGGVVDYGPAPVRMGLYRVVSH